MSAATVAAAVSRLTKKGGENGVLRVEEAAASLSAAAAAAPGTADVIGGSPLPSPSNDQASNGVPSVAGDGPQLLSSQQQRGLEEIADAAAAAALSLDSGRRRRAGTAPSRAAFAAAGEVAAACAPPSAAAAEASEAPTGRNRPQRPRRPPRKFAIESEVSDITLKKALKKSRLETRRVEVDYAALPSIPEIRVASFDDFFVNPVAFYERLDRCGREYGGVKILPPEGWKPPFSLQELLDDALEFHVRVQDIHKIMQGAKFRHPAAPQRASRLKELDRKMKQQLFGTENPSLQQVEALYWQSVETSSPELTVHYAADLKTNEVGSGFPTGEKQPQEQTPRQTGVGGCSCASASVVAVGCCRGKPPSKKDSHVGEECEKEAFCKTDAEREGQETRKVERKTDEDKGRGGGEVEVYAMAEKEIKKERRAENVTAGAGLRREKKLDDEVNRRETDVQEGAGGALEAAGNEEGRKNGEKEGGDWQKTGKGGKNGDVFVSATVAAADGGDKQNAVAAFYAWHPWNLTRFARQQGSLLSTYHRDVAGVTSPWLYVGMIFSSFCWHAEDNYFAACNYHHWGDAKVWYIVPPSRAASVERMLQQYLSTKDPDYVLHSLTVQLPPSLFVQHRVPVYRVEQKENEFLMLWPRTYHAGFNVGFNCNEACNFAPASWLPWGHRSINSYRFMRSTCIPYHQLLLRAACNADNLAASQLLHVCQALMRLLHEEYALRQAAKEEYVATGLMCLDHSQVSQLESVLPDAGGVVSELLNCRRELQHIVGKPLLPELATCLTAVSAIDQHTTAGHDDAANNSSAQPIKCQPTAACIDRATASTAEEYTGRAGASPTRAFLDAVAAVASLPVKDCDNCRSCCAVSCFTCPHVIEHTCLECLGQQTCECKLQMALVRFSLPTLFTIFDHVRTLFLAVCKREAETATQKANGGAMSTDTYSDCTEAGDFSRNVPTGIEACEVGSKEQTAEKPDAAGHLLPNRATTTQRFTERSAVDQVPASYIGKTEHSKQVAVWCNGEEAGASLRRDVCIDGTAESSQKSERNACNSGARNEPDKEALRRGPSPAEDQRFVHTAERGKQSAQKGEELPQFHSFRSGALQPSREAIPDVSVSKMLTKQERRAPQQKRGNGGGGRRSTEATGNGGRQGQRGIKRREDALLRDPVYLSLPSLKELMRFEEATQLLDRFSDEYYKSTIREIKHLNKSWMCEKDKSAGSGVRGFARKNSSLDPANQQLCSKSTGLRSCSRNGTTDEEIKVKVEDKVVLLDSPAPSSIIFEEKRGSLFMRGENWSLSAVVSLSGAELLTTGKSKGTNANAVLREALDHRASTPCEDLKPTIQYSDSVLSPASSHSTFEISVDIAASQRVEEQSFLCACVSGKKQPVEARSISRRALTQRTDESVRNEVNTTCKKRKTERQRRKKFPDAEEAMKTLVKQMTWRYFLSALKDEEEDNDERILPVFRKAGARYPQKEDRT